MNETTVTSQKVAPKKRPKRVDWIGIGTQVAVTVLQGALFTAGSAAAARMIDGTSRTTAQLRTEDSARNMTPLKRVANS